MLPLSRITIAFDDTLLLSKKMIAVAQCGEVISDEADEGHQIPQALVHSYLLLVEKHSNVNQPNAPDDAENLQSQR